MSDCVHTYSHPAADCADCADPDVFTCKAGGEERHFDTEALDAAAHALAGAVSGLRQSALAGERQP